MAPSAGSVHPSIRKGRSPVVVVVEISGHDASEMALVQSDDMIETVASQGSDEPLHERVLPWTSRCAEDLPDPHALDPPLKRAAVDRVTISMTFSPSSRPRARRRNNIATFAAGANREQDITFSTMCLQVTGKHLIEPIIVSGACDVARVADRERS